MYSIFGCRSAEIGLFPHLQEHLLIVCELLKANLYEFHKYNRESGGEVYFTMPRLQVHVANIFVAYTLSIMKNPLLTLSFDLPVYHYSGLGSTSVFAQSWPHTL